MATGRRESEEPLEYEIEVFTEANDNIIEITKWYDLQSDGLGARFLAHLREAINKLRTHPLAFGISFKDMRKIQLDTFPYLIFYKVVGNQVNIYGIVHAKRKPSYYKRKFGKQ